MTEEHSEEKKGQETEKRRNGETGKSRHAEPGTRNPKPASGDAVAPEPGAVAPTDASPHPLEALLDEYPLREQAEDPVWSVRIIRGWLYFLAFNITWIILFLILGIFYE